MSSGGAQLTLRGVVSGYGPTRIVEDLSVTVAAGQTLAVLGRNGVGKSTLLGTIAGRTKLHSGTIHFHGQDISQLAPHARCRTGLAFVPQDRQVFKTLTVDENLKIADLRKGWSLDDTYLLFPRLAERRRNYADSLSGGEQQMLAIGRALMGRPTCLLLDEPFEGLAPVIVEILIQALGSLRKQVGLTLLLVEQHARVAVEMADAGIVLDRGRMCLSGQRSELISRWSEVESLLSVH